MLGESIRPHFSFMIGRRCRLRSCTDSAWVRTVSGYSCSVTASQKLSLLSMCFITLQYFMWSPRLKVGQNICAQRRLAYYPYQNTGKGKGGMTGPGGVSGRYFRQFCKNHTNISVVSVTISTYYLLKIGISYIVARELEKGP